LALILGGAESNLWDLCKVYAAMSSTINHYDDTSGNYYSNEFLEPSYLKEFTPDFGETSTEKTVFDAGATFMTLNTLKNVNRPQEEENWEVFDSSKEIAWKTGTSFGFRDAWAIGASTDYVVGVWVGNADGEGRPGLTGVSAAAPILFDIFNILPQSSWFQKPFDELVEVNICKKSGYRASEICEETEIQLIPISGLKSMPCPYHFWVHLNADETFQVNTSCEPLSEMVHKSWFVLPPLSSYYFRNKNPFYKNLPRFRSDCSGEGKSKMDFIYPKENVTIFLPKDFDEIKKGLVLKVAHQIPNSKLFWYLNNRFVGTTNTLHQKEIRPEKGNHIITVIDAMGNEIFRKIEVK
jgi:penicillin-binding protein 1C